MSSKYPVVNKSSLRDEIIEDLNVDRKDMPLLHVKTDVQPVFLLNRQYELQSLVTLDVVAVQNTWYTVFDRTGDLEIDMCVMYMATAQETLEVSMTIDGVNPTDKSQVAVANTNYWIYMYSDKAGCFLQVNVGEMMPLGGATGGTGAMKCRSFKMEVRKTTAAAGNHLMASVLYHKRGVVTTRT